MSFSILASVLDKPDRIKSVNKDTDVDYHRRYGRWTVGMAASSRHSAYYEKIRVNKSFYAGADGQWMFDEDTEAFLKDDTNQRKNRIKIVNNIIRPLVEQYRGNANRMGINAEARSVSRRSKTRMDAKLEEKLFAFDLTLEVPEFKDLIIEQNGLGESRDETTTLFNNTYVDEYSESITKLIQYVKELNEMVDMQIKIAENIALSGMGILEGYEHGGHMRFEIVESEEFYWDQNARRYDLQDSDFMGRYYNMLPTDIYERYNVSETEAQEIENYVIVNGGLSMSNTENPYFGGERTSRRAGSNQYQHNKIPVFRSYWRDTDVSEWGYVIGEFGYKKLVRINHMNPGQDTPDYTDGDLIDPPNTPKDNKIFKGKKKTKRFTDVLRYCVFIPSEILATGKKTKDANNTKDVVLDWGMYEWQESDLMDQNNVKFPFKAYCWGYVDGQVLSPVDDAISPQRFINRVMSVTEQNINNTGGTNVVIDDDALNPQDIADGTADRNIKQGKPLHVRSRGLGVQNVVTKYDNTPTAGTYAMFDIIPIIKQFTQETTGVNEPLQGQSTGSDQLVGVTEILLERGSLMQEPFYHAVTKVFSQAYQMVATVGKRMYLANERDLALAVGDQSAEVINLAEGIKNEDFRVFIKRTNDQESLIAAGDKLLAQLFEFQIIDKNTFSMLFGHSTPDQVTKTLRMEAGLRRQASKNEAQAQQEAAAQGQQQEAQALEFQDAEQERLEVREDKHRQENREDKATEQTREAVLKSIDNAQQQASIG